MVDPSIPSEKLMPQVRDALEGGIAVLQIWDNWPAGYTCSDKVNLAQALAALAEAYQVPVLVNEEWQLLQDTALDGVHFDTIPQDFEVVQTAIGRKFICGVTCGNNLDIVRWAEQHHLDYVSFCAVFPSSSAGSCELVRPDTIRLARSITQMPLFVSGGITTENLPLLQELDFNGVAVISGILNAPSAKASAAAYTQALTNRNR